MPLLQFYHHSHISSASLVMSLLSCPPPSCIDQRKQEELCSVFWFVGLADQQTGETGGLLW